MNNISTIVFDLGRVLIDFDHNLAAERIKRFTNKSAQEIYELIFSSDITILFEEGKISPQEFFAKMKAMLELNLSYESFVPIWNEIFFWTAQNRAVYGLASSLRQRYKIVVLSNINILHYEYLKQYFPLFSAFNHVFTSFELGCIKPGHEIYKKTLEKLNVSASEVFYTDDRQELVESARQLGINSFCFTGIHQLKSDLTSIGVNIN